MAWNEPGNNNGNNNGRDNDPWGNKDDRGKQSGGRDQGPPDLEYCPFFFLKSRPIYLLHPDIDQ